MFGSHRLIVKLRAAALRRFEAFISQLTSAPSSLSLFFPFFFFSPQTNTRVAFNKDGTQAVFSATGYGKQHRRTPAPQAGRNQSLGPPYRQKSSAQCCKDAQSSKFPALSMYGTLGSKTSPIPAPRLLPPSARASMFIYRSGALNALTLLSDRIWQMCEEGKSRKMDRSRLVTSWTSTGAASR